MTSHAPVARCSCLMVSPMRPMMRPTMPLGQYSTCVAPMPCCGEQDRVGAEGQPGWQPGQEAGRDCGNRRQQAVPTSPLRAARCMPACCSWCRATQQPPARPHPSSFQPAPTQAAPSPPPPKQRTSAHTRWMMACALPGSPLISSLIMSDARLHADALPCTGARRVHMPRVGGPVEAGGGPTGDARPAGGTFHAAAQLPCDRPSRPAAEITSGPQAQPQLPGVPE